MDSEQVCELREKLSRIEAVISAAAEMASALPSDAKLSRLASLIAIAEEQTARTLSWLEGTQARSLPAVATVKSVPA